MKNVVAVENLSKKFFYKKKGNFQPKLINVIKLLWGKKSDSWISQENSFWALRDISFNLKRGDSLGVVGLNGAGKSTLLKILLKRLYPDKGNVSINGSAGGLIELGSGFHPESTGRRNIELNAKLLGASKLEITEKLDDIIKFADIGDFIDLPVKTYSSGMSVRLGFAVAIKFIKDLVVCDEVLSVGDFEFRQKCLNEINKIREDRSFILVSHSNHSISLFCNKAILLHKGHLVLEDKPDKVLEAYSYCKHDTSVKEAFDIAKNITNKKKTGLKTKRVKKNVSGKSMCGPFFFDKKKLEYVSIEWNLESINDRFTIKCGEKLVFKIGFKLKEDINKFRIGIPFFSQTGEMIIGPDTRDYQDVQNITSAGEYKIEFSLENFPINEGELSVVVTLCDDPAYLYRQYFNSFVIVNPNSYFGLCLTQPKVNIENQ